MKLMNLSVHNVLRVSDLDLDMEGVNLALVGGANAQGKTSALTALLFALSGRKSLGDICPDIVLKEGETSGWIKVKLSGDPELHEDDHLIAEVSFKRKRGGIVAEELRLLDSTGEEAPTPRAVLNDFYQLKAFDPLSFERAKPVDREKLLRDLAGLNFEELDEERLEVFSQRTVVNRDGKAAKAQFEGIEIPPGTPDEPISVTDLLTELVSGEEHNANRLKTIEMAEKSWAARKKEEQSLKDEEEKLRARLIEIDALRKEIDENMDSYESAVKSSREIPQVDVESIRSQMKSSDEINKAVANKEKKLELREELDALRASSQRLTDRLKEIDEEKQARLESAKWPIPNMSIDESGVLLNDLPFEQASKAERIIASVHVGMALNPKLRLLVCQDGNDLDNDTLEVLESVLVENDFQMLLEFVTRSESDEERCVVVFQDGKAKESPLG